MKYLWFLAISLGWVRGAEAVEPPEGMVRSFQGLLQLEQDATVSDEAKVKAWKAFIRRTKKQSAYAQKAIRHWNDADRLRWLESARATERDPRAKPRQKIAQWKAILDKYPDSEPAIEAKDRILHWRRVETQRLVQIAERVESHGRSKVDRIQVWRSVRLWAPDSPEGRAAAQRISALQKQLVKEAESIENIDRIDIRTKMEAWEDVLKGQPTKKEVAIVKQKIAQLRSRISRR